MDAGRGHKTPGSETKSVMTYGTAGSAFPMIPFVPNPVGVTMQISQIETCPGRELQCMRETPGVGD